MSKKKTFLTLPNCKKRKKSCMYGWETKILQIKSFVGVNLGAQNKLYGSSKVLTDMHEINGKPKSTAQEKMPMNLSTYNWCYIYCTLSSLLRNSAFQQIEHQGCRFFYHGKPTRLMLPPLAKKKKKNNMHVLIIKRFQHSDHSIIKKGNVLQTIVQSFPQELPTSPKALSIGSCTSHGI